MSFANRYNSAGVISSSNSLVGSSTNDQAGSGGIIPLTPQDGIVIHSPLWDNGAAANAGAVTVIVPGNSSGVISSNNSLVGSTTDDQVGSGGIPRLGEFGGFVVLSPLWNNGSTEDAGAASIGWQFGPFVGTVSSVNSFVGSSAYDQVGSGGLAKPYGDRGSCFILSPLWDHRTAADAGAINATETIPPFGAGVISAENSLVGSHPHDQIGSGGIIAQTSPQVIIQSPNWCYGAGAVTQMSSWLLFGIVDASNSAVGAETAEPEFALQQPAPAEAAYFSTHAFDPANVGASTSLIFTIKNNGTDDLRIYALSGPAPVGITGTDASMFTVEEQPPMPLVTGDSTHFTVNFKPTSPGPKTATLSIMTDVHAAFPAPFQVFLTGNGLAVPLADWRLTHFGNSANTGTGADTGDFDHDGISNLAEYAFGLHPNQGTGLPPAPQWNGGNFEAIFTEPGQVTGVTYGAEWSTTLAGDSWLPVTDTGTAPQHVFSVPIAGNEKMFMRLKVTATP